MKDIGYVLLIKLKLVGLRKVTSSEMILVQFRLESILWSVIKREKYDFYRWSRNFFPFKWKPSAHAQWERKHHEKCNASSSSLHASFTQWTVLLRPNENSNIGDFSRWIRHVEVPAVLKDIYSAGAASNAWMPPDSWQAIPVRSMHAVIRNSKGLEKSRGHSH